MRNNNRWNDNITQFPNRGLNSSGKRQAEKLLGAEMLAEILDFSIRQQRNKSVFADYGLDVKKNFLQAPDCECGEPTSCGNKADVVAPSTEDLVDFIGMMLQMNDITEYCAIFVDMFGDSAMFGFRSGYDIKIYEMQTREEKNKDFGILDEEFDFDMIGLLVQKTDSTFKIIEK